MPEQKPWNWCVVGNIKKTHVDPDGTLRYGSSAFCGGTKVYLQGRYWSPESDTVWVCGLDRDHRYSEHHVPIALIENVRLRRTYKPSVVSIMYWENWWHDTPEDRSDAMRFMKLWNGAVSSRQQ